MSKLAGDYACCFVCILVCCLFYLFTKFAASFALMRLWIKLTSIATGFKKFLATFTLI